MQRGLFITLEGIDGAGKSSHQATVRDWLAQHSPQAILQTREPGGTPLAETLRGLLLNEAMQPTTELLLVFAARAEHCEALIKPALASGQHVISDRFTDATVAYQGAGRGLSIATIKALSQIAHPDLLPDLTLIFTLDAQTAHARVSQRGAQDRFESESQAFAQRVAQGYAELAARQPQRCVLINGGQPIEAVANEVRQALTARLSSRLKTTA